MWVVLALSASALGFFVLGSLVSMLLRNAIIPALFAALVGALGLGCVGAGFTFRSLGMNQVERALAAADPGRHEQIRAVGRREASIPLAFGVVASVLPLVGAAGLAFVAISRYRRGQAGDGPS